MVTVSDDGTMLVWNVRDREGRAREENHSPGPITGISRVVDGEYLACRDFFLE